MQTSYSTNMDAAFAGMLAYAGVSDVKTFKADEEIPFGRGLARATENTATNAARLPVPNQIDLTFSTAMVSSNVFTCSLLGSSVGPVTFSADDATTLGLIATAMEAVTGIDSVDVDSTNHVLTITADVGTEAVIASISVTGGTGQPTSTTTRTTTDEFVGVALALQAIEQAADGTVTYAEGDAMSVLRKGAIRVPVDQTVKAGDPVYWRYIAGGGNSVLGSFRKDADSGKAILLDGVSFAEGASAGGFAVLEVNKP